MEKRQYKRYYGKGRLPGRLSLESDKNHLIQKSEVIDVSERGLGILTDSSYPKGSRLQLVVAGSQPISLEVIYCYLEHGHSTALYNIGLFARSENVSIAKLLAKYGVEITDKMSEAS